MLGIAALLGNSVQAQTPAVVIPPGKLAVFKAGTTDTNWPMLTSRVAPCFVQVFDPATTNQSSTNAVVSVAMATNSATPGSVWVNHHAGSEGGGLSRSLNRQYLCLEGYVGNILSPTSAKPSTDPTVGRGIVTLDSFTNAVSVLSTPTGWFGIPLGSTVGTQDNPTGICSPDGTNFYGTGNFAALGTATGELDGTLFYNSQSGNLQEVQQALQAAGEARIIGGMLLVATKSATGVASGLYNFIDPASGNVVPQPWNPSVANPYFNFTFTNLYLNWGTTFKTVLNFDMDEARTVAYGADQAYGIVKFTNNAGNWVQAPYYFSATNIGTLKQAAANQGCFGICVDFSGPNPVIYATTMENGTVTNFPGGLGVNTANGHQNNNRLIKLVDTGVSPGTNYVATTLATAATINEFFGGVDFTPDLRPLITSQPATFATTLAAGGSLFNVTAVSASGLNYQWLENGLPLDGNAYPTATNASLDLTSLTAIDNYNASGFTNQYQCVITNNYGSVTSLVASLIVTVNPTAPRITSGTNKVTAFVGANVVFAPVVASGTAPFTYQWYHAGVALVDDGVKYAGSTTASLSLTNLVSPTDSGNYSVVISNPSSAIASNVVDILTVSFAKPSITPGQPAPATTFVGNPTTLVANQSGGTPAVGYQWYLGKTPLTDTTGEFVNSSGIYTGAGSSALTINATTTADSGSYSIVYTNGAGSVTSAVATVTVLVPPAHSLVAYSNQVYIQTFDALPDPGYAGVAVNGTAIGSGVSVNSFNNPLNAGFINGVQYSLGNPFDFAYPVIPNGYLGGLGLANGATNMNGWYGVTDTNLLDGVDSFNGVGISRFGAQNGDQSTGGVIDFGLNDSQGGVVGTNRALGVLSTSSTGSSAVALKLVNTSANTLNYVNLSWVGEMWRNNKAGRTLSFSYAVDPTGNSFALQSEPAYTNNTPQVIPGTTRVDALSFNFPANNGLILAVDGTSPVNQTNIVASNLALSTPWTPGATLWLIWSCNYYGQGTGQGYAIDNLKVAASTTPIIAPTLGPVSYNTTAAGTKGLQFSFTDAAGAAAQFTTWSTTNLTLPFSQWTSLGHPTEVSPGVYQVNDAQSITNAQRFYKVTSP